MFQISVGGETMHIGLSAFSGPVVAFHTFFPSLYPSLIPQAVSVFLFFFAFLNPTQIVFVFFFPFSVSSHPSDLILSIG